MSFLLNLKMKFKVLTTNDLRGASIDVNENNDDLIVSGGVRNFKQLDLIGEIMEDEAQGKKVNNELKLKGKEAEEKLIKVRSRVDDVITSKLNDLLENYENDSKIEFKVYDGNVVVKGEVESEKEAREIESSIWQLEEVKDVINILSF